MIDIQEHGGVFGGSAGHQKEDFTKHMRLVPPSTNTATNFRAYVKGEGYWYATNGNVANLATLNGTLLKTVTFTAYSNAVFLAVSENYMFWQSSDKYSCYMSDKNGTLIRTINAEPSSGYQVEVLPHEKLGRVFLERDAASADSYHIKVLNFSGTIIASTPNSDAHSLDCLTKNGIVFSQGTSSFFLDGAGVVTAINQRMVNSLLRLRAFKL